VKTVIRGIGLIAASAVLVSCAAISVGPGGGGRDTKAAQNRLVLTIVSGEEVPAEADFFVDELAKASGGSIQLTVDNTSIPGDKFPDYETRVIQYVADGKADLGVVDARAFDTVGVQSFAGLQAPFLIDSYGLEDAVLRSNWGQALLDGTRSAGVVGIGYVNGILRRPLGYTRSLLDVSDYADARIGIRAGNVAESTMESLGAMPVVFPPGDTRGLDGMEVHANQILLGGYDVGADSLTGNVAFWPRVDVIFANAGFFDRLNADQQAALRSAGRNNLEASIAGRAQFLANILGELCAGGITIKDASHTARANLRAAVQPVYDELEKDPGTRATIMAIEALRASLRAPADTLTCDRPTREPPPASGMQVNSPIVGTWTTSFTRDALEASPLTDLQELLFDETWGDFTLVLGPDGRMTLRQANAILSGSQSGTYSVDGYRIVISIDGLGRSFAGRWSVFRDTLTFVRVGSEELPTPYVIRAWTRVP
jgi:TRAP-type C4-dicarboxylate transport system substrate-binding protein